MAKLDASAIPGARTLGQTDGVKTVVKEVFARLGAVTHNGTHQRFQGSYVLRRVNNIPGSTSEQRRWHLQSANLAPVR